MYKLFSVLYINFYSQALTCDHPSVVLEVVLGMESMITKVGATLQSTIWENVLKILKSVAEFVSKCLKIKNKMCFGNIIFKIKLNSSIK